MMKNKPNLYEAIVTPNMDRFNYGLYKMYRDIEDSQEEDNNNNNRKENTMNLYLIAAIVDEHENTEGD